MAKTKAYKAKKTGWRFNGKRLKKSDLKTPTNKRRVARIKVARNTTFDIIPRQTLRTKKTALGITTIAGANSSIGQTSYFTLSSMPDYAQISALFNRYRINKIKFVFSLIDNSSADTPNFSNVRLPKIYMRHCYDSNLSSGSVNTALIGQMNNLASFQMTQENTRIEYTVYPRTIGPVYLSGVSNAYSLNKQLFIDSTYNTVPHYGILWYVDYLVSGLNLLVDLEYDVTWQYAI